MTTGMICFVASLAHEQGIGEAGIVAFAAGLAVDALPRALAGFQSQLSAEIHARWVSAGAAVFAREQLLLFSFFVDCGSHEAVITLQRRVDCVAAS